MSDFDFQRLRDYEPRGIVLDANLLVVRFVSFFDPNQVGRAGRTDNFTPKDALLLDNLLPRYAHQWTTPGVLAEATNLAGSFLQSIRAPSRELVQQRLQTEIALLEEQYFPARDLVREELLLRFGFTDLALANIGRQDVLVLTTDLQLALMLEQREIPCVNYNHIRPLD